MNLYNPVLVSAISNESAITIKDSPIFLLLILTFLLFSLFLKKIKQPYIIGYICAGIILGPFCLKVFTNLNLVKEIGEFGLIILMFFIGMEISLPEFLGKWKISLFGTGLQIIISIFTVSFIGYFFNWEINRLILLGCIISLSSSAVVIKLLEDYKQTNTKIGQNIIIILLTQDILIIPIIILLGFLKGGPISFEQTILQLIGGSLIVLLTLYILIKKDIKLPFSNQIQEDHELQVFTGLIICFGFAFIADFFRLSPAIGAFMGGILVNSSKATKWLEHSLNSFRIILVAIFFVSIGILIDLNFLAQNFLIVFSMVIGVYITNSLINTIVLKLLDNSWAESIYGGAMLSQIGELSFVLASLGLIEGIINEFSYKLTIIIISTTILFTPYWVIIANLLNKKILKKEN